VVNISEPLQIPEIPTIVMQSPANTIYYNFRIKTQLVFVKISINKTEPMNNIKMKGYIRNCFWGYKCEQTWESLLTTKDERVKFCGSCQKEVHRCETMESLAKNVALNRCVNFPSSLIEVNKATQIRLQGHVPTIDFDSDIPF